MTSRNKGSGLRGLVLGGAVAVSSFSLSGCIEFLGGYLIADHHARVVAEGQRDAAGIIAGTNMKMNKEYFTCNYYIDENGNDIVNEGEIKNKKSRFRIGEPILCVGSVENMQGQYVTIKVFRGDEEVKSRKTSIGGNNWLTTEPECSFNPGSFAVGNYNVVWESSDGRILGATNFEVCSR